MHNSTYEALVCELTTFLGTAKDHDSDSGARFTSSKKGKATVYHANIASGNHAEVAVDIPSNAARLGITEREMRERIASARSATGRDVEANIQYNWPRIGVASPAHVPIVVSALRAATENT